MKKLTLIILSCIGLVMSANSFASGSAYTIGGTTYYNFDDGVRGSSYDIGGTTYYNFNNGVSGSSYQIGGTTYWND